MPRLEMGQLVVIDEHLPALIAFDAVEILADRLFQFGDLERLAAGLGQRRRGGPGSGVDLPAEAVERAALALERVDDVHGGDRLSAGVLRVGDGVADDVLEEDLEHAAGLLVDEARDALDAAAAREAADGGLGDALDVVPQHLTVTLGASLSESLSAVALARLAGHAFVLHWWRRPSSLVYPSVLLEPTVC